MSDNYKLLLAINEHDIEEIKFLLENEYDIDLDIRNEETGKCPLHLAVFCDCDIDIVKLLIEYGSDINAINLYKQTSLHLAILHNRLNIAEILIEYGAEIFSNNIKALNFAIPIQNVKMIELLLKNTICLKNKIDYHILCHYLWDVKERSDILELLIKYGFDINEIKEYNESLLYIALMHDNLEIIKYLFQNKVECNMISVLEDASVKCNIKIVKFLLEIDFDVIDANKIILKVNENCRFDVLKLLLEHKSLDFDVKLNGNIIFDDAIKNINYEIIDILFKRGFLLDDDKIKILYGMLDNFIFDNYEKMIKIILYSAKNESIRYSTLYKAILNGNLEIIKLLLDRKLDITEEWNTLLHLAIVYDELYIVKRLLNAGVNDITSLSLAKELKNPEMIKILEENITIDDLT